MVGLRRLSRLSKLKREIHEGHDLHLRCRQVQVVTFVDDELEMK